MLSHPPPPDFAARCFDHMPSDRRRLLKKRIFRWSRHSWNEPCWPVQAMPMDYSWCANFLRQHMPTARRGFQPTLKVSILLGIYKVKGLFDFALARCLCFSPLMSITGKICVLNRERRPMQLIGCSDIFNSLHTNAIGIEYTYYGQLPFNPRRVKTGPTTKDGSADVSLRQQNLRCF